MSAGRRFRLVAAAFLVTALVPLAVGQDLDPAKQRDAPGILEWRHALYIDELHPLRQVQHHECSAAHAEALTGDYPFARHYAHAGMIGLDGEKMSKSRGNLVFVSRLRADGVDMMALRLALLSGHYRSDRSWTETTMAAAERRLDRWRDAVGAATGVPTADTVTRLREHLGNDLNTPAALAAVDAWAEETNAGRGRDTEAPRLIRDAVDALLGVAL